MLAGAAFTTSRQEYMLFTLPVSNDQYIAFGTKSNDMVTDLIGHRIGILASDCILNNFILPFGLISNTVQYDTYTGAFNALLDGHVEYVISP
jgi:ABC-type amino acid transport substrate-binding protein